MKLLNPKIRQKFAESLKAVLPVVGIVIVLSFTIAPITSSILLCFLVGAVMVMVGMMFFTLGAEMSMTPMGEKVVLRKRSNTICRGGRRNSGGEPFEAGQGRRTGADRRRTD